MRYLIIMKRVIHACMIQLSEHLQHHTTFIQITSGNLMVCRETRVRVDVGCSGCFVFSGYKSRVDE